MKGYEGLLRINIPYYKYYENLSDSAEALADEHKIIGNSRGKKYMIKRFKNHLYQLIALILPYNEWKKKLHIKRGVHIGKRVHIGPFVHIDGDYPQYCILENGCSLAGYNIILTHFQPLEFHKHIFKAFAAPTIIGKNATVAIGAIILPGVTIGEGSMIAAGAVVTEDIPAFSLAAGVPAKVIKQFVVQDGIPIGFKNQNIYNNSIK